MNPPYSHGLERGGTIGAPARGICVRHWKRLLRGRLVAVMPSGSTCAVFGWVPARVTAAQRRDRAGLRQTGTSITTRLLVLDKGRWRRQP